MLPNQLFFEWICVWGKRKLIEISFYSSQTLSSDFRVQYCKMWQALIRSDIDGVKQSSEALGVGEMYGLLACILTARSWDVVTTGIDQGPVTDHEVCFRVLYVWVDLLVVIWHSLSCIACSRLRDGGGKSFSNKKCEKRAIFPAATASFPKSCASYFRFARFTTFPLYYLRAWHRLYSAMQAFVWAVSSERQRPLEFSDKRIATHVLELRPGPFRVISDKTKKLQFERRTIHVASLIPI